MLKEFRHIIMLCIALLSTFSGAGEQSRSRLPMPDNVCVGARKHYEVDPNPIPGSVYTWKINGEESPLSHTNSIDIPWDKIGNYLLEVQEHTAAGCDGDIRSGMVYVTEVLMPVFDQIPPLCQHTTPPQLPPTSNNGIKGTWSPAMIKTTVPGSTIYTFTPAEDQCAKTFTMDIVINASVAPIFDPVGPYCAGEAIPSLPLTSNNGIKGTWAPAIDHTKTTAYTFTPDAGQCATSVTMSITVTDQITPAFTQIADICLNSTAPTLPLTSTNGINGTWNPSVINTSADGKTTYTFTPAAGQCATTATMDITITDQITPTFTQIADLCLNSTAPQLPLKSDNNITGTWSPAVISTTTAGSTTYTFTPDADQCATPVTMSITVTDQVTPTFTQIADLCLNSTAPVLPLISNNGIPGSWNPAVINTSTVGKTTYTFTPSAGQCAGTVTLDITVTGQITPSFTQIADLCLNSTAPALPLTSNNEINGTWNPAVINTSTVGKTTYTFTPSAGQCATTVTLDITVTGQITPSFTQIADLCLNSTAPALPLTSTNGITGTWSPTTINTSAVGKTTYTFTPAPGQCAGTATMDITISDQITPIFTQIADLCQNSTAPVLPLISNNGIPGSWNPATINTSTPGTRVYTFTPVSGKCATTATMSVTVNAMLIPEFTPIANICQNGIAPVLPLTSNNGVPGTWNPTSINTSLPGITIFAFTPSAGQCAAVTTISVTVDPEKVPVFTPVSTLCLNGTAPVLPLISNNGIRGTWNPAVLSTAAAGTSTYTFTPDADQCARVSTLPITVEATSMPVFKSIEDLCQYSAAPALPGTSDNGIKGIWNPATISTLIPGTTTYTFTPSDGNCTSTAFLNVTVIAAESPIFDPIENICQNAPAPVLPAPSKNGITGTWSPAIINTSILGTTTYTFTPAGKCIYTSTINITIDPLIVPVFTSIGQLCVNSTPPDLSLISNNGITGTWDPAAVNTSAPGITTYTFTPASGQCATTATISITVQSIVTPEFTAIGNLCQNSTPPALSGTSNNGISGKWNPAEINTATSGTTVYTFTPSVGQCAGVTTLNVTVDPMIIPEFTPIANICQNEAAPTLPAISLNNIKGTWDPEVINTTTPGTTVYNFTSSAGQCASATTMSVTVLQANTVPLFTPIGPLCHRSTPPVLPATSINGINGTWNPSTISTTTTGTKTYTFTPAPGQCAATVTMDIIVATQIPSVFDQIGPLCLNSVPPLLPTVSNNGIIGTWNPSVINTATQGTTRYTFTPDKDQCGTRATMDITVSSKIVPSFAPIGPICKEAQAPVLPATSLNGVKGTWNPASINTSTEGTIVYTFTPEPGGCWTSTTLSVIIEPIQTPVFTPIANLCQNSKAPTLSGTSTNGIPGSWNPATINTSIPGTRIYTFTPTPGQCATPATLNITVDPIITTEFTPIANICQNSPAPVLPLVSNNGIAGTWNPATINTSTAGTRRYTFTPAAELCATKYTMDITIDPRIIPDFTPIGTLCLNSAPPVLPLTSTNGITGTWNPSMINTSIARTTVYTFTPATGQCASTVTINITVAPITVPVFKPIADLCQFSAAPALPVVSDNGISGTWNPASINTSVPGTTVYAFTPNQPCATTATLSISIIALQTPVFTPIANICQNGPAPALPSTSNNGFKGTWNPATINTSVPGTTTYRFTPSDKCVSTSTLIVTIDPQETPVFTPIGSLCINSTPPVLPLVSNNNIKGTWNPAVINTSTAGTQTYIFTPDAVQCASTATINITVDPPKTPAFAAIANICQNSTPPNLPVTSENGITGTWNPATINTSTPGTRTYTFTPSTGQCATNKTLSITVDPMIIPEFDPVGNICQYTTAPVLPNISRNNISGTWNPSIINTSATGTNVYTFTPTTGQCASTVTMSVTVDSPSVVPIFAQIDHLCQNITPPDLPSSSNNGIKGSWSPSIINTSTPGTISYIFTPEAGQCATPNNMIITVMPSVTPTFTQIGPLCRNSKAPALPLTSNNGISGTWNPSLINTSVTGTATYTFTPADGQCASTATLNVTVEEIVPSFNAIADLCTNSVAPALPSKSINGITGTWNPAVISTSTAGKTTYTFTPASGQCATTAHLDVTVTPVAIPVFTSIGPLCQNSTAPVLPLTSNNGITGNWSPATISTSTAGIRTYTFTPSSGQCATPASLNVTIDPLVTPVFTQIAAICQNSTAPALPLTSNNGIPGTWNPATINTSTAGTRTYTFTPSPGQCASTTTMSITVTAQVTPNFTQIAAVCQNSTAPALPLTSNNSITGTWNPAAINTSTAGTTTYTFTPAAGQCAVTTTMTITVTAQVKPSFTQIASICQNSTAPALPLTSNNGITGTWNPATINTSTAGTRTHTFTPATGQCAVTATMDITVTSPTAPVFTAIGPQCQNSAAPTLPLTSNNGITGTWSPATISTSTAGTTTYTFTPAAGQCATTAVLSVTINALKTPTFDPVGSICLNGTAPALPLTSNNGITGTWNPATISTSSTGTNTYTFTPAPGQCATTATLSVTIATQVTPVFTPIGPLCLNAQAPALPLISNNGITGTWSPSAITTSATGTKVYTFTPSGGSCASATTLSITVDPVIAPAFTPIANICQNSTAPALPLTSTNGITGTWNPATINTSTAGTRTYTFTPAAGQCATPASLNVTIDPLITPVFTQIAAICQNSTAPALPLTSSNGIPGTWNPATINTSTAGTRTYTFTPSPGQCASTTTMSVTVTTQVTPNFTQIAAICQNSTAPALPLTSNNSITGTWNPATINASTAGTTTYAFTPAAGQCAVTTTMTITVTAQVKPSFTQIASICQNSTAPALPLTSNNGITGTWNPSSINTSTAGTRTYTFTPAAGQCALTATMDITVTSPTAPVFTAIGPQCQNSAAPTLPLTSNNGITGTWSPATISTSTAGTTTYTFTPAAGQCATTAVLSVTINALKTPTFDPVGSICLNGTAPALPLTSNNGITGTWNPATISTSSTGTNTYTFTPAPGQCATTATLSVTIATQVTPVFTPIGPLCLNAQAPALPLISNNGITGTWIPSAITTSGTGTKVYTFTPSGGSCASATTLSITVDPVIAPAFTPIANICQNSTAPALPLTSTNGITGTWNPATINTSSAGTRTYTFTPASGQCATPASLNVTIDPLVTPVFTQIAAICQNSTAPALPLTSNNGIPGTWNPATINTSTAGTRTYTFTPSPGQCASTTTMSITVTAQVTPNFTQIAAICQNSTAPALPLTSTNGIPGTWNPAAINTSTAGTTTYTFTPAAGQCAVPTTMTITVTAQVKPSFTQIASICQNSTAPALPLTSNNGITGTWNPSSINTSTTGTRTYTFTPAAGQCAVTATMDITVTSPTAPVFTAIEPLCQNSAAPTLPLTSNNGITGTWSPATISTSTAGTTTYTFTPAAGQCATTASMTITIEGLKIPSFNAIGDICLNGAAPALPSTSINGISGTWDPSVINTSTTGTKAYVFTPLSGQCATSTTLNITVSTQVTPVFTPIDPLCQNSIAPTLPLTSNNGIKGSWNPASINTSTGGKTTYTFTPAAAQCAIATTMEILVTDQITPVFTSIGPLCQNSAAPALPLTSNNGIKGTWNPAAISTSTGGKTTYTFTPAADQCATTAIMEISVTDQITPEFTSIEPLCQNSVAPALPLTSNNGIKGTWNPAAINTSSGGKTTYTFTPAAGQCATTATMEITVTDQISPVFTSVGPLCQNSVAPSLPLTSNNGIKGTWNPASINTSSGGKTTYIFTPAADQCATTATMEITVTDQIAPVFTSIGPLCQNSAAPALPLTSNNGIKGTWNPAAISTSTGGKTTYTFTPAAGQCATTATMEITVTDQITPVFTSIGQLCQNSAAPNLPLTSNNGITGTWSPALINTASAGQTIYTFTPAKNECAGATTSNIVVNAIQSSITEVSVCSNQLPYRWNNNSYNSEGSYQVKLTGRSGCDSIATLNLKFITPVIPAFDLVGPLNQYSTPPALLSVSQNNISGTWIPDKIDTSLPGTTVYTFTPSDGQCADKTQMSIEIKPVMIDAVISGAGVIGSCQQIKLDASRSVGDITKYEWSVLDPGGILTNPNEISTSFMLSASYNGSLPSDFRIRLQVTDRSGKTDSDTVKVRIEALPRAFIASSGQPEKDGSMLVDGSASTGTGLNFKWSTSEGKIVGQANKPSAFLLGAGLYSLEITDSYGCKSIYTFKFPIEQYKIIANPDYARTSWSHDTTIYVMENDVSTAPLIPGTVRIIKPATHGDTRVNPDGSVVYIPKERMSGKDEFIYEICDAVNLCDSALVSIYINDEEVQITEAFSPNGDGKNEQLVFKGLEHYPQSRLHVYTRSGQLVYQSNDYKNDWDGRITQSSMSNKKLVPTGVYYYVLELGGTTKSIKGFVYIGY